MNTKWIPLLLVLVNLAGAAHRSPASFRLEHDFTHPPAAARPWVYWYWVNGNTTRTGITADLEAMQRVGIGGVLLMDATLNTPIGPAPFGGQEWREHVKFAVAEAHRLGLEVNLANAAGWCGSGGPWITPELSQKIVSWTETQFTGGKKFAGKLAQPRTYANWFRDIAVLAVPTPEGDDITLARESPKITVHRASGEFDPRPLIDGDPDTSVTLSIPTESAPQFIELEFSRPYLARSLALSLLEPKGEGLAGGAAIVDGDLQVSDNGRDFRNVCHLNVTTRANLTPCDFETTFAPVTARWFRIRFTTVSPKVNAITLAEMELSPRYRIEGIKDKAAFWGLFSHVRLRSSWPELPAGSTIARGRILDLTPLLKSDGELLWDSPAGKWTILRIGYASSGRENHPAPEGGRGLECDKLDAAGAEAQFAGLLQKLLADSADLAGKTIVAAHIDSWEVGFQNWSRDFRGEFLRRRGYDPLFFLPVLTGRVVDRLEISERFLWDFRQTISDLVVENYAGRLRTLANERGLRLSIEAYDHVPASEMTYAGQADEPMGEFFSWSGGYEWGNKTFTITNMVSAAHVYGKRIIGAEAFTASQSEKYQAHPANLKHLGDWAFCLGINRFNFHASVQQPWENRAPGMSLSWWGLHYQRTLTWWEQSGAWHAYLARCQHLLRQGRFVADICCLEPEGAPMRASPPASVVPVGMDRGRYAFDCCTPEVVLTRMKVVDGRIVLPDGMNYRLLMLPAVETMTPTLLRKLTELVAAGATVLGAPPLKAPGLTDYPRNDEEVTRLAKELWGDCDGVRVTEHRFGLGRVIWGRSPTEVLESMEVGPDFHFTSQDGVDLDYLHRTADGTEIYFVANKTKRPGTATCTFRSSGRPELWSPVTGEITRPAAYNEAHGRVTLPIRFDPDGSAFVIFRANQPAEPDRITSISRAGTEVVNTTAPAVKAQPAESNETNGGTFTMALWVKPETDISLPLAARAGVPASTIRNFVIFPSSRNEPRSDIDRYPSEEGHSTAGLSVGKNGVTIYEQSSSYFTPLFEYIGAITVAPLLVYSTPVTEWTHATMVFNAGEPLLYLNGRKVGQGLKSIGRVHPGVVGQHRQMNLVFQGDSGELRQFDRALTETEIGQLMQDMPLPIRHTPIPPIEVTRDAEGHMTALVRQPGKFEVTSASGKTRVLTVAAIALPLSVTGPWTLNFPPNLGAPPALTLNQLISWTDHPDAGIKYYSGAATYRTTIEPPAAWLAPEHRLYLDLGRVEVMAEVKLNGRNVGMLWKSPYRLDVTGVLHAGSNALEITVINLPSNRQIGDEFLPEDTERNEDGSLKAWPQWVNEKRASPTGRVTFATTRVITKDDRPDPSGLMGPVTLETAVQVRLK